ncbi:MAG: arginine--tRNA ligase [Candidatus Pelagibacter sp.]|nr:arginine--tRNA ligase [Candidatus Pelagibacter sp.]|tara:strand:+ start:3389 stop:5092 length:1704 start_codon:yes stop_codon:yes gene_type:complete
MNIFEYYKNLFLQSIDCTNVDIKTRSKISVEIPKQKIFGDISFNAPLILGSTLRKSPLILAEEFKNSIIKNCDDFEKIEIAKPGFINFTFKKKIILNFLSKISGNFGLPNNFIKKNINIEFVSANPTGPLHIGHCRGAIYGDVLCNFLKFCGHDVTKEYYINDYGNQITLFLKSIYFRIIEILKKEKFPQEKGLYPGEYIIDIANELLKKSNTNKFDNFKDAEPILASNAISIAMSIIKNDLKSMGIKHDVFISESNIVKKDILSKAINELKNKGDIYTGILPKPKSNTEDWEPRKQMLFKSTNYGDDTDRALKKSDNSWTYFANDIAYHYEKLNRNYDYYINILGADHSGYTKRLSSAVIALNNKKKFEIKICQIVKLYKDGKPYRMSKRAGDFILAKDLIDTVGKDAARFMMVYRSSQSPLDFDFDLVSDKSKDNPIFYVQYACARLNSLFKKSEFQIDKEIENVELKYLENKQELNLLKKILEWPKIVNLCLSNLEVHYIPYYLYELSSEFHSFWNAGKENDNLKIIDHTNKDISKSRLFLLQKLYIVLKLGLNILDVKVPKKM